MEPSIKTRKGLPLAAAVVLFALAMGCALFMGLGHFGYTIGTPYVLELAFFAVLTYFLLRWQERAMHTDPKGFVRRFMTGLVLKMLVCLFVVLAIAFLAGREQAIPLVLSFALLYLAFLVFSVARLMARSKRPPAHAG